MLGFERLTPRDFADLFGTPVEDLSSMCLRLIEQHDFRYRRPTPEERDRILLEVFKRIDSGTLSLAGKEGKERWDRGWEENLQEFRTTGELVALVPKYIRPHQPVRLNGDYAITNDPEFELHWYEVFQQWLFETYFRDAKTIYEFGCGSGINLARLGQMYPEKRLVGLDWAQPSVDIVNEMGKRFGWNMTGRRFDFFDPDESLDIDPGSLVFTIGALEQTGKGYHKLTDYFLRQRPMLYVHVEPVLEWYQESSLVDYAAIRFHKGRNYWEGFPVRLAALQKQGKVSILKTKRSFFGSLFLEGYSQLVWKPVG